MNAALARCPVVDEAVGIAGTLAGSASCSLTIRSVHESKSRARGVLRERNVRGQASIRRFSILECDDRGRPPRGGAD